MEMNLQMFAENTQTTAGLSAEMKTYYGMELLENAKPQLVHNQFAATKGLPAGGGKTVEWRKFGAFDKALKPLTEGVTPDGSGISVSYITKELAQYGDYTTVSDMLDLTAIDDVVLEITDRHGSNMGLTLDTVTRNEIQQGKQVIYAPKIGSDGTKTDVTSRMTLDKDCRMTSELVAKAATQLKKMNAPTFDGKYVCIIHPSVAFDLRQDEAWIAAHQYAGATELFSGEIGELHGVRFRDFPLLLHGLRFFGAQVQRPYPLAHFVLQSRGLCLRLVHRCEILCNDLLRQLLVFHDVKDIALHRLAGIENTSFLVLPVVCSL